MVDIVKGFRDTAKAMPYIRTIAISLVMTVLIVGVFVYQATSGTISVGTTTNTALTAIETGVSSWNTSLIAVVGTVVALIILGVIMALVKKKGKGSNE